MAHDTRDIQSSAKHLREKGSAGKDGYKGIPIFAATNLHESCFSLVEELRLDKDAKILIVGAGGGAFDQRLLDHGYTNIAAVEFVKEGYMAHNKRVYDYDLNDDFHSKFGEERFDLVIAIEIIEHLYSPYDFLRKVKHLLREGGHLVVSTPNPENGVSRIKFLLARKLQLFSELDLRGSGHIVPIFDHIFCYFLQSLGLTLIKKTTNGHIFKFVQFHLKLLYLVFFPLVARKRDEGQIRIYLVRK